jgi:hypothetical protein
MTNLVFIRDFIATSGREHGRIYLGGTSKYQMSFCELKFLGVENSENISESGIKEGWLEVRPGKQVEWVLCDITSLNFLQF